MRLFKKTRIFLPLLATAISLFGINVADNAYAASKGWKPKVEMTRLPVFPDSLIKVGITRGKTRLIVVVSETGELIDWLVVEATHWEFAKSIARVIEGWNFEGARSPNQPRGEVFQFKVLFAAESTARMTAGPGDMSEHVFGPDEEFAKDSIRLASPSELDALPTPFEAPLPDIPSELIDDVGQEAVFEFYIDMNGEVHAPILQSAEIDLDERILTAAQNALWNWKFYPPTANGKPVVAKVALPLVFSKKEE